MSADDGFADWSGKTAFFFPGQGAQYVGMATETAEAVPKAKELFDKASEILGYDLLERCRDGPKDLLDKTAVCQPAIFVASMAAVEKLRQERGEEEANKATCCLGLSLGEYSALCYAGALSFEDGVKITKTRGEAMQSAADGAESGMVSVIGLDSDTVGKICDKAAEKTGEPVIVANYLCNGNYVTSGSKAACEEVMAIAKPDFKARMTVKLAVAGAFHTDFMKPAVEKLEAVLSGVEIKTPRIPVISNVDARPHSDPDTIKQLLAKQVTSPVQWESSVKAVLERGYESGYELGPGTVLAGILKRIDKTKQLASIC